MKFIPILRIYPSLRWGCAGVLLLLFSLTACQNGETALTRFEDSPVIDSLLDSAPHFVVNTDIEPERWIATTRLGFPTDLLILGSPSYMISVGDSIYVSEWHGHNIFAVGDDGYLSRKIGGQGKAPVEFNHIRGIDYDGSHIFVRDLERIQVFTEKFEYVGSFFHSGLSDQISVSPEYIYLECIGIDWLVCPYSKLPPYSWIESAKLLPVLEVDGRSGENANAVTVSPEGDRIAVAYIGLPYIFVYDDQFMHLKTIRFEGKRVRDFEPAVGPPAGSPEGMEPGTRGFIRTIKFLGPRYLIVNSTGNYVDVLDLSENDYEIVAKVIFSTFDDTEKINPRDFLLHGDYLYVSSPWEEYIYGYEFDLE